MILDWFASAKIFKFRCMHPKAKLAMVVRNRSLYLQWYQSQCSWALRMPGNEVLELG